MKYYLGYELAEEYCYLNDEDKSLLYVCVWLVDNKSTIRKTAANWGYSSTTLWRRIHKNCKNLSPELYHCVKKQFKINLKKRGRRL